MRATYADLERQYDGMIPADEVARCVEPKAPRTPFEWARWSVRRAIADLRCVIALEAHPRAVLGAGEMNAAKIKLAEAWIAYRAAQANEQMTRIVDTNIERIAKAFDERAA